MVKDHSESEKGDLLSPHWLIFHIIIVVVITFYFIKPLVPMIPQRPKFVPTRLLNFFYFFIHNFITEIHL